MGLLDEKLIQRFKEVGEQILVKNPIILAKFYAPWNDWEWYVSEYYKEANAFYGYVIKGGVGKWCYFRNPEKEGFGEFQIKRDLNFSEGLLV